jgi:SAM-dependent methyltransferase
MQNLTNEQIRQAVRENYGQVALADDGCGCSSTSCCSTNGGSESAKTSIALGYSVDDVSNVPEGANMGLGCGNPQAIAALKQGETVLDLGSGGGFDCFLAARSVGKTGRVIGIDMTQEMISKARANAVKLEAENVEFHLGEIEHLPLPSNEVDVVISNCVINLSPDKTQVFKETLRVLKPGGRLAISDIVATAPLPADVQGNLALYTSCVSGAALINDLETMLDEVGFTQINITPKDDSKVFLREWSPGGRLEDFVVSANIEAVKPV